jgi:hypothetical protein
MNAHPITLERPTSLIDMATRAHGRVARVAIHATPSARFRLLGELALLERVVDEVECEVTLAAKAALKAMPKRKALPKARRKRLPPFQGGRGLLPKAGRAS